MTKQTLTELEQHELFLTRHIGPDADEQQAMLNYVGAESLEDLTAQIVPESIRLGRELNVGASNGEAAGLAYIRQLADKNQVFKSYIGMGYHGTEVPNVILRNVLENPGWYTAYTPYQPEIAQGRLEAILNFQQLSIDLTGLDLASASLLDEATAAAEAMALAKRVSKAKKANTFFVADDVFPQTLDVVKTRAECFGFDIVTGPAAEAANHDDLFGALFQYTNRQGQLTDFTELFAQLRAKNVIVTVGADIMSLVLLKSPGAMGADVEIGRAHV